MTNADYYLKEGTNREELLDNFREFFIDNKEVIGNYSHRAILDNFLCAERMPTLTEYERVILHYVDNRYTHIQRACGLWLVNYEDEYNAEMMSFEMYSHLFQFIKERRRILY